MTKELSKIPEYASQCIVWKNQADEGRADYYSLGDFLRYHAEGEKLHSAALAYGLYMGYVCWATECPFEIGSRYDFDFYRWAYAFSGKERPEADQYRRVGELLELVRINEIEIPKRVQLMDERGRPLYMDSEGEPIPTYQDGTPAIADPDDAIPIEVNPDIFSPQGASYSKLLLSRHVAMSDDGLTEIQWGALFNPKVTCEQYRRLLSQDDRYGWQPDPDRFHAWLEGRCILVSENGEIEALIDGSGLNLEALEEGSEVARKAFGKVSKCLGLDNPYNNEF